MKRFVVCLPALGLLTWLALPAAAYENFIPMGSGYSTGVDSVAEINSPRDELNAQTDVIETDIYRRAEENRRKESYINRFFSDSETSGSDFSIDY